MVEEEVIGQIVGLEVVKRVVGEEEVKIDVCGILDFRFLLKEVS